jgi:hypothetical protein
MTIQFPAQCMACARRTTGSMCEACPAGIPAEIGMRGDDHRRPRGDEVDGLVFEQADTDEARWWFASWTRYMAR